MQVAKYLLLEIREELSLLITAKGADYHELKSEATQIEQLWSTCKANEAESQAAKGRIIELCRLNAFKEALEQQKLCQTSRKFC